MERLSADTEIVGYPVLPLCRQLTEMVDSEHAKYIHWGATTQDIQDTASILQIRHGLLLMRRLVISLAESLGRLAKEHRDT